MPHSTKIFLDLRKLGISFGGNGGIGDRLGNNNSAGDLAADSDSDDERRLQRQSASNLTIDEVHENYSVHRIDLSAYTPAETFVSLKPGMAIVHAKRTEVPTTVLRNSLNSHPKGALPRRLSHTPEGRHFRYVYAIPQADPVTVRLQPSGIVEIETYEAGAGPTAVAQEQFFHCDAFPTAIGVRAQDGSCKLQYRIDLAGYKPGNMTVTRPKPGSLHVLATCRLFPKRGWSLAKMFKVDYEFQYVCAIPEKALVTVRHAPAATSLTIIESELNIDALEESKEVAWMSDDKIEIPKLDVNVVRASTSRAEDNRKESSSIEGSSKSEGDLVEELLGLHLEYPSVTGEVIEATLSHTFDSIPKRENAISPTMSKAERYAKTASNVRKLSSSRCAGEQEQVPLKTSADVAKEVLAIHLNSPLIDSSEMIEAALSTFDRPQLTENEAKAGTSEDVTSPKAVRSFLDPEWCREEESAPESEEDLIKRMVQVYYESPNVSSEMIEATLSALLLNSSKKTTKTALAAELESQSVDSELNEKVLSDHLLPPQTYKKKAMPLPKFTKELPKSKNTKVVETRDKEALDLCVDKMGEDREVERTQKDAKDMKSRKKILTDPNNGDADKLEEDMFVVEVVETCGQTLSNHFIRARDEVMVDEGMEQMSNNMGKTDEAMSAELDEGPGYEILSQTYGDLEEEEVHVQVVEIVELLCKQPSQEKETEKGSVQREEEEYGETGDPDKEVEWIFDEKEICENILSDVGKEIKPVLVEEVEDWGEETLDLEEEVQWIFDDDDENEICERILSDLEEVNAVALEEMEEVEVAIVEEDKEVVEEGEDVNTAVEENVEDVNAAVVEKVDDVKAAVMEEVEDVQEAVVEELEDVTAAVVEVMEEKCNQKLNPYEEVPWVFGEKEKELCGQIMRDLDNEIKVVVLEEVNELCGHTLDDIDKQLEKIYADEVEEICGETLHNLNNEVEEICAQTYLDLDKVFLEEVRDICKQTLDNLDDKDEEEYEQKVDDLDNMIDQEVKTVCSQTLANLNEEVDGETTLGDTDNVVEDVCGQTLVT